jgi:hypothetical protein
MNDSLDLPMGVCLACFNEQERFSFPFVVYCPHKRTLALVHGKREHATFECAPNQLQLIVSRLRKNHPQLDA